MKKVLQLKIKPGEEEKILTITKINVTNYEVYSKRYWSIVEVTQIKRQIFLFEFQSLDNLNQYTRNRP